jgi:tetratricopeptide (TPR) repeat protein
VCRSDAKDLDGWYALTGLLMKEGQYEIALGFLREAFIHHSGDPGIKIKMAVCHLKEGEKDLAIKFLEEALQDNADLESEFSYFFPAGKREADIERIIQKYKKL